MLLYFVKTLNARILLFILLYFLRFQEGGATAPLNPPLIHYQVRFLPSLINKALRVN